MSLWKGLALFLVCFCILATIIGTTQARYPERFPDKSVVGQSNHADDAPVCWGDDADLCIEWDTDGLPDGGRITQKDCDGSPCDPLEFYKEGGGNVIAMRASSFTNPDGKMTFGAAGASSHSCGANCSHFTGNVELDGTYTYVDNQLQVGSHNGISITATDDIVHAYVYINPSNQYIIAIPAAHDRLMVITDVPNYFKNHGLTEHVDLGVAVFSSGDVSVDNTQYSLLQWNRLALGGDGGGFGCINQTISYADFMDSGGASGTFVLDEGIPDGAVVQRAILHSLTGFTGDTSAFIQIGDGTDVDRYSTGTPSVFTTNPSGCDLREPSGTAWHDDAKTVVVTITSNADFTSVSAGAATVAVCYWTP
jgi:hypothetical protein